MCLLSVLLDSPQSAILSDYIIYSVTKARLLHTCLVSDFSLESILINVILFWGSKPGQWANHNVLSCNKWVHCYDSGEACYRGCSYASNSVWSARLGAGFSKRHQTSIRSTAHIIKQPITALQHTQITKEWLIGPNTNVYIISAGKLN
jgi:hypothetical protein